MKYKYEGLGKNKKIKEQRKKPLPMELMKCNDSKRLASPKKKSNS